MKYIIKAIKVLLPRDSFFMSYKKGTRLRNGKVCSATPCVRWLEPTLRYGSNTAASNGLTVTIDYKNEQVHYL